ncbi:MAG TPA: hypothetical protein VM120_07675 [Bryobacteraceae bacterium]|nr:hypothetical protein [Bryobacteraceae bacterium]
MLLSLVPAFGQDPLEIVRKSVNHDLSNWQRVKDYTYVRRTVMRERDSQGAIKKVNQSADEILILYGQPYERQIEKDGKPLSPEAQKKEQLKLDKTAVKRRGETVSERAKRLESFQRDRQKERDFAREVPDAYNFKLLGEEVINGRKAWIIDATPRPDYEAKNSRAAMLKKFRGRMWIDQKEFQWVRLDGEAIDTVTWGLFLARLAKGSKIFFEQLRVNDEVWMPKVIRIVLDARLALLKRLQGDIVLQFENFRKFQSDSHIVEAAELE